MSPALQVDSLPPELSGKGMTKDEMIEWHHRLKGHEFEQTPGGGEEQGSLACCSPWGHNESDTTEQLNNNRAHVHAGLPRTAYRTLECYREAARHTPPLPQLNPVSLPPPRCVHTLDMLMKTPLPTSMGFPSSLEAMVFGTF